MDTVWGAGENPMIFRTYRYAPNTCKSGAKLYILLDGKRTDREGVLCFE